jgi:hypothetical protein
MWPSVAVGVLALGLFAAWLGGVFKVKTPEGVIVLANLPKDADVFVDGDTVTVSWPGGGEPAVIRPTPGRRKLEVKKDGFTTFAKELTIKAGDSQEVTVRLDPLVAEGAGKREVDAPVSKTVETLKPLAPPTSGPPSAPASPTAGSPGWVPLFNGNNLSGWKTHPDQPGFWQVRNRLLIGRGPAVSHLYSERGDFKDFMLVAEARINESGNSGVYGRASFGLGNRGKWPLGYEAAIDGHRGEPMVTGSLYAGPTFRVPSALGSRVTPGQWFRLELRIEGTRVTVLVDDQVTVDYFDEKRLSDAGHIALQVNSSDSSFGLIRV